MDIDNLRELLIKNGYKVTKQREIIFEALKENSGSHLSPEELHDIVIKKDSDIGIATVYRTLQLLDELKVVYKINFNDNRYRYEISSEDETHHHHHLICTNCNKIIEVKRDLLEHAESKKNLSDVEIYNEWSKNFILDSKESAKLAFSFITTMRHVEKGLLLEALSIDKLYYWISYKLNNQPIKAQTERYS